MANPASSPARATSRTLNLILVIVSGRPHIYIYAGNTACYLSLSLFFTCTLITTILSRSPLSSNNHGRVFSEQRNTALALCHMHTLHSLKGGSTQRRASFIDDGSPLRRRCVTHCWAQRERAAGSLCAREERAPAQSIREEEEDGLERQREPRAWSWS